MTRIEKGLLGALAAICLLAAAAHNAVLRVDSLQNYTASTGPAIRSTGATVASTLTGTGSFNLLPVQADLTIATPTIAPTIGSPTSVGACSNTETYEFAYAWLGPGGRTAPSTPSAPQTTVSTNKTFPVTRPSVPSGVSAWQSLWARLGAGENYSVWRECTANNYTVTGTATINCGCSLSGNVISVNDTGIKQLLALYDGEMWGAGKTQGQSVNDPRLTPDLIRLRINPTLQWTPDAGATFFRPMVISAQAKEVCKSGGCEFSTVAAALAAISDNTSTKRYAVIVHPGDYDEAGIVLKPYVAIVGLDRQSTRIRGNGTGTNTLTLNANSPGSSLMGLTIGGQNVISTGQSTGAYNYFTITDCDVGIIDGSENTLKTQFAMSLNDWTYLRSFGNTYNSTQQGIQIYVNASVESSGDTFNLVQATAGDTLAAINRNEPSQVAKITGARITMTSANNTGSLFGYLEDNNGVGGLVARGLTELLGTSIHIVSTGGTRTDPLSCVRLNHVETGGPGHDILLNGTDCIITSSGSSGTVNGIEVVDDGADQSGHRIKMDGGNIQLTGGATRNDVNNAATNASFNVLLKNVANGGVYAGSGKTYTATDFPAAACSSKCSVGISCVNSTPALCFCTAADTWTKVSGGGACP